MMGINLELDLPSNRLYCGEDIPVELRISNTGTSVIEVPDGTFMANATPLYHLVGPSYPRGVYFNLAGVVSEPNFGGAARTIAVPRALKPGGIARVRFRLASLLPLTLPGGYEVEAFVACGGEIFRSDPIAFDLTQATATVGSVGREADVEPPDELWSSWLLRSDQGAIIVRRFHNEGERNYAMQSIRTDRIAEVGVLCSRPLASHSPRGLADRRKWVTWFEGSRLFAHAYGIADPLSLDTTTPLREIVPQPLMLDSEALDVFIVDQKNRLSLVGFYPPQERGGEFSDFKNGDEDLLDEPEEDLEDLDEDEEEEEDEAAPHIPAPEILWSTQLSTAPHGITASLVSQEQGGGHRLVYAELHADGVAIRHLILDEGCDHEGEGVAFIPHAFLIPDSSPGLRIDAQGLSQVSVLLWRRQEIDGTDHDTVQLCLADVRFHRTGSVWIGPETTLTSVCKLEDEPVSAAIDFYEQPDGAVRRDWVVILKNGRAFRNDAVAGIETLPVALRSVIPAQILCLRLATCLAVIDSDLQPQLAYI
jgi:hypothetical protein